MDAGRADLSLVLPAAAIGGAGGYSLHIMRAAQWDTRFRLHEHPSLVRSIPAGVIGLAAGAAAGWAVGELAGSDRTDAATRDALVGIGVGLGVGALAGRHYATMGRRFAGPQAAAAERQILTQSYLGATLPAVTAFGGAGLAFGALTGA